MSATMNFKFSLTHNNLVAQTFWFGDLNYEIIVAGVVSQNQWIVENSNKFPLILVSDYTKASLNNVSESDLHIIADQFHGEEDLFPDMTWVVIMPSDVKYEIVRLWIDHAGSLFKDSHVVRNWSRAENIISDVLTSYNEQTDKDHSV